MKNLYILIVTSLITSISVRAQIITESFEGNNFRWFESTNTNLFYNPETGSPGLEVPVNGGNHIIFAQSFWIGGKSADGDLHLSALSMQPNDTLDFPVFIPGPLRVDGTSDTSAAFIQKYNRFWYVTREQIEANESFFNCLYDPDCDETANFPNGYTVPEVFENWPAQGNFDNGIAEYLAPFFDRNENGEYEPDLGDHPIICGDFEAYSIANDKGFLKLNSESNALGIELHTMVYGYESADSALFNTLFVKRKIINRSAEDYHDVYLGLWTEFDIGNWSDDYVRTDVTRAMIFGYNGDVFDDGSASGPGYGYDLPAAGVKLVSGPLLPADGLDNQRMYPSYETYANQGPGWEDGIIDNERLGLSSSIFHYNSANSVTGDPQLPEDFYNYMNGLLRNGSFFTYGAGLEDTLQNGVPAHYFFPGNSDPFMAGTDGIDPQYNIPGGWTEESQGNPPGDKRMLASSGPFDLNAGSTDFIDYAVIFTQKNENQDMDYLLEKLRNRADAIVGMECTNDTQIITDVSQPNPVDQIISVFPNPTSDVVHIQFGSAQKNVRISIFDIQGRRVKNQQFANISESTLGLPENKGIYLVEILTDTTMKSVKVIVQ